MRNEVTLWNNTVFCSMCAGEYFGKCNRSSWCYFKNILLANVIVLFANMICEVQFLVVLYIIIFLHNTCMFHYQHVLYSSKD